MFPTWFPRMFQNCFQRARYVKTRFWKLTLEGWIVVFKSLAISKLISQALTAPIPTYIIKASLTIQTSFLWNNSNPKIKHKILCKRYEESSKQCSKFMGKKTIRWLLSWVENHYFVSTKAYVRYLSNFYFFIKW